MKDPANDKERSIARDLLSSLNNAHPTELSRLSSGELERFETLCEIWLQRAARERSRRSAQPDGRLDPLLPDDRDSQAKRPER